jgi:hypothetical protein
MIEQQADHFTFFDRQPGNFLVESTPTLQVLGIVGFIDGFVCRSGIIVVVEVALVVGALPARSEKVPGQIEQFTAHLLGGQGEKSLGRVRLDLFQRSQQTQDGVLEYVVRLRPAVDVGIVPEHLAREPFQPVAASAQQFVARGPVARLHAQETSPHQRGMKFRLHGDTAEQGPRGCNSLDSMIAAARAGTTVL